MEELREVIIDRVATRSSEEIRFKNQMRGEPELTFEEKRHIVQDLLMKSPSQFLARFGLALQPQDLDYFSHMPEDDDVAYHVRNLEERLDAERLRLLTKNRRYAALSRLETSGYFDEVEMQKRDPLLYEELVEKYLTDSEKAELEKAQRLRDLAEKGTDTPIHPFADLLMESLIVKPEVTALKNKQKERDNDQEEEADSEEECEEEPKGEPIDDGEKSLLRQEFRDIMTERFLDGKDAQHVDYNEIDCDSNLDAAVESSRDEEERYFDDEEPSPTLRFRFSDSMNNDEDEAKTKQNMVFSV